MQRILVSYPKYFNVSYSINPWMDVEVPVDKDIATAQWETLITEIKNAGGKTVNLTMPDPELPDFVFTANAGIIVGDKAVVSAFRDPERQPESPYYKRWFKNNGYNTLELQDTIWEGEACMFPIANKWLCSYGIRAEKDSYEQILPHLGIPKDRAVMASIVDPYFYHLDVCFCPLDNESAMFCELAFDGKVIDWMKKNIKNLISVSYDEALNFACNALVINDKVLMNSGASPNLKRDLRTIGYQPIELDISEFIKAGGGVKCLTLYVNKWKNDHTRTKE